MSSNQAKTVAVFIPVDDDNWRSLALNLADIRRCRDVRPHVLILDRTESGIGEVDGASVIAVGRSPSLGDAFHAGLMASPAEFIALSIPGVRVMPNRLARQRADLSINRHIDMVTSNLVMVDKSGCLVAEANPEKAEEAPTPFWQAGVMIRRRALARIGRSADLPVELFLYIKLKASGRTSHMDQVFSVIEESEFQASIEGSLKEALAIRRISPPIAPRTDRWVAERVRFDERLAASSSVTDALDRMIREGTFDR